MAIDNDKKAQSNSKIMEDFEQEPADLDSENAKTWRLGSPEGKKANLRVMAADLTKVDPQYRDLDERVRDFIAWNVPEEAVQIRFEDNIYVSPFLRENIMITNFGAHGRHWHLM